MKTYLLFLFACLSVTSVLSNAISDKNILIVHSYHQGLDWTDHISHGIDEVLLGKNEYQLFYEYLDTKRNLSDDYMEKLYHLFEMKVSKMKFSAVIASDNAAFDFLLSYAKGLFSDIPIVFCGINNAETLLPDLPDNVYLLGERADHRGTLSLIAEMMPKVDNVMVINDYSLTGRMIQAEVEAVVPEFEDRFSFQYVHDFTIEELEGLVGALPANTVIYLLVINRDSKGEFISYRRGIDIVKRNSDVPIFGSWDFYLNRGLLGGMITTGERQGRESARLLIQLLENSGVANIPHFSYVMSEGVVDYTELVQWGISVKDVPDGFRIINGLEESRYKKRFYILLAVFLFLMLMGLLFYFQKRRTHRLLELMVDEKTAELRTIIAKKDQFLSLIAHDLRSPSGAVAEGMNFLINSGAHIDEGKRHKFMKELAKSANKVFSLLEDMLLWGRVQFSDNYKFKREPQRLSDLVSEVASVYYYDRDPSCFINQVAPDYQLYGDAFVLKFILRNLISNALKFSDVSSPIVIGADELEDYYRFWVTDQGKGMTEEVVMSIVHQNPIQTVGNKGQQSFGIGLNAVADYLQRCGGVMTIDSHVGQGTSFYIYVSKS